MKSESAADGTYDNHSAGLFCGIAACLWWGFSPCFYKLLADVPPLQVLAHRVVWSAVFFGVIVTVQGRWGEVRSAVRSPGMVALLALSSFLVTANWYTFIYAVVKNQVTEASLGYFIGPMVQAAMGIGILSERLRRWQGVALLLTCAGIALFAINLGRLPLLAIVLTFSFATYALMRKIIRLPPMIGLMIETALAAPVALAFLMVGTGVAHGLGPVTNVTLALAGVMTGVPLILFAHAARRLRMITLGLTQYVNPTCQFLLAVLLFHEPMSRGKLMSFVIIWVALAIYTIDSWRAYRRSTARVLMGQNTLDNDRGVIGN